MSDHLFNTLFESWHAMSEESLDNKVWYHGSTIPISRFTDDFVGQGIDKEGPGIYFTDNEEDAYGYSKKDDGGVVYRVYLNFKKIIQSKGKANRKDIIKLILWADNAKEKLRNYDENLKVAITQALYGIFEYNKLPKDQFLQVAIDFYRYEPQEFVKNMVTLGYDGLLVKQTFMNTTHAVVYNPKIIKVIDL